MKRGSESLIPRPEYSTPVTIALLFVLGAVSALTILLCFFWLTARLNDVQTEGAVALNGVVVADTLANLEATVRDFSYWDLALDVVQQRLDDDVADILGSSATDSDLFDQLLILSPDGGLLYDFQSTGAEYPRGTEIVPNLSEALENLGVVASEGFDSVSGYVRLEAGFAAAAVAHITPEGDAGVDPSSLPIMVGLVHLDAAWMEDLTRQSGQTGYGTQRDPMMSNAATLPLPGAGGAPVGYLNWDESTLGSALREEVQGVIIAICIGIFTVTLFAARFFNAQHRSLQHLRQLAATDQLTGILNRAGLDQVIRSLETSNTIASGEAALIYLDLNDFKRLNDELGHHAGDEALRAMAKTLQTAVRDHDVVARLGGDEFVCLLTDKDPHRASIVVTERIKTLTGDPIQVAGTCVSVKPSIGVAVAGHGFQWDMLLSQADSAMYRAKRDGSLSATYFNRNAASSAGT